jgi:hypothetical protein
VTRWTRVALAITLLLSLTSCAHIGLRKMRADSKKRINREQCEREGGKVEGIGMFGLPACVHYYTDGGRPCRDGSDCQGYCFLREVLAVGTPAEGICESSEHDSFGCFSRIDNGMVAYALCQD